MERFKRQFPVDHGWAWWVMVGYFLNLFLVISWVRALAILLPVLIEKYQQSTAMTTLAFGISEISESITHVLIPLFFMSRFSVRSLSLLGAVAKISAILSLCISPNIVLLNVAFAVLGFARGFITNPQVYLLGVYFNKRHSFASAVANTGLSMATLVSPLLTQLLLDTYGLWGTFLVFGGITMHSLIASMLFRPVSMYDTKNVLDNPETQKDNTNGENKTMTNGKTFDLKEHLDPITTEDVSDESERSNFILEQYCTLRKKEHRNSDVSEHSNFLQSLQDKDSHENHDTLAIDTESRDHLRKEHSARSILTNPTAISIILTGAIGIQTQCGNVYMPVMGLENGLNTSQVPWLLTISGVCDIIGKLFFGLLVDRGLLQPMNIVCLTQLVVGIVFQFVSLFQGMVPMVIFCIVFGFNAGMIMCLHAPITIEYVGLPSLPFVTSSFYIGSCVVTFLCHLVVGSIKDMTGSFAGGYQFMGAMMLASLLFLTFARWSSSRALKSKERPEESNTKRDGNCDVAPHSV